MPIISEVEAREVLAPYLEQLQACMQTAWLQWQEGQAVAPRLWLPLSARTRASFLYDHICREAKERFANSPEVSISEACGFLRINFLNLLLVRFKKLNRFRLSSNIPTRQQTLYGEQLPLPGMPTLTRATVGYELDYFQTRMKDFWVTCPQGNKLAWSFALSRSEPTVLVTPSTEDMTARLKTRIRRKQQVDATPENGTPHAVGNHTSV